MLENSKTVFYSKIAFFAGALLLFISLFLEWYTFQVFDETRTLIASWKYNLLFEWDTPFSSGNSTNEMYHPLNLEVPLVITILFIGTLLASMFAVLFKDTSSPSSPTSLRKYSYMPLSLVIITIFYIVGFPIMYLLPNELYFPGLTNSDTDLEYTFSYSISLGYILQLCGFVLIFSYSLYYYTTITALEKSESKPHVQIDRIIHHVQERLDLDKYIAEEENRRK
jgi:hypothetical protein